MKRFTIRSVLVLVAICVGVLAFVQWRIDAQRDKELANRMKAMQGNVLVMAGMTGFGSDDSDRLGLSLPEQTTAGSNGSTVGWRQVQALAYAGPDSPPANMVWSRPEFDQYDDMSAYGFCLEDCTDVPRVRRFTRVMAIRHDDSAYERIRKQGWEEVLKHAPDAILLVEVVNSNLPWMAAGDFDPAIAPNAVNPVGTLGIGANKPEAGLLVAFVDGEVWYVDASIPYERLEKFLTVSSASKFDRDEVLGPFAKRKLAAAFRSPE